MSARELAAPSPTALRSPSVERSSIPRLAPNVPRTALSIGEACESLGIGHDHWSEHVAPHVRIVRLGRRKLVPVVELERFLIERAERVLPE